MDDLANRALTATKYTIVFRITAQGLTAVSTVFLVRVLSEHDYGVYNLLYSTIPLIGMVFSLGIANTLQRYIPEYYSRGEFRLAHKLFCVACTAKILTNALAIGLIIVFWDRFGGLLKIGLYKNYFLLFSIVIVLYMQRGILETCLGANFLQKYSQGASVVFSLLRCVGYALAIVKNWGLWHVLLLDVLTILITVALLQWLYYNQIPITKGNFQHIPKSEWKRIKRYALFYNFNDVGAGLLGANFDNFIIALYLDPVAVGAYAFCQRITTMVQRLLPVNYLIVVLRPLFFAALNDKDSEKVNQWYQTVFKLTYLFYIPLFAFILLYGQDMIRLLFGGKFLDYFWVLVAVAAFALLGAFQFPVGLVAQLKEKAEVMFYSKVFALYNLAADFLLIHIWGIWGAVIATGSATVGKNLFIWTFVRHEASMYGMGAFLFRSSVYWCLCTGFGSVILLITENPIVRLFAGGVFFVLSFVLQFRFLILSPLEKNLIKYAAGSTPKLQSLARWLGFIRTGEV